MDTSHFSSVRSRIAKWLKWFLFAGAGLVIIAALAGIIYQWTATRATDRRYPAPGELIDIGGHRLHIHRQGSGSPSVVIDAGLAGGSYEWDPLAAELSSTTEVYTYDRAGYGWSDRGPNPRSSQRVVAELHTLLERAKAKPPYILVGHSFGGLNVRLYANKYPDEVAGLILVDALNFDSLPESTPVGQVPKLFHFLNSTAVLGTPRLWAPGLLPEPANNPEARARLLEMLSRTKSAQTVFEELTGQTNWQTTRSTLKHLGDKPVVIISRRIEEEHFRGEFGNQNRDWLEGQKALIKISNKSKRIIASTTNHCIQFYEPKLIIDTVRLMVEASRTNHATAL